MIGRRDGMDTPPSVAGLPVLESVKCHGECGVPTPLAGSQSKNVSAKHTGPSLQMVIWVPSTFIEPTLILEPG